MRNLLQDLRHGIRILLKNPGFAAVAVFTLALGIGANTAIFSVVNAVLLRPLPYTDPDRLALIRISLGKDKFYPSISGFELASFREQSRMFESFEAIWTANKRLSRDNGPEHVRVGLVTWNYLKQLGVAPVLGRHFLPEEDLPDGQSHIMLSYGLWERSFGADPHIIGQTIYLDGFPLIVVGVMPKGFQVMLSSTTSAPDDLDGWQTITMNFRESFPNQHWLRVTARMKPGVTIEQAQAEMDGFAERFPRENNAYGATELAFHVVPLQGDLVREVRPALLMLIGAVGFVLLIACVNVANLLLARASVREKEIAIRFALGASRWRIFQQIITESLLLAAAGGTLGILIATWGLPVLRNFTPASIPRIEEAGLDGTVLLFTVAATLMTAIIFSAAPALKLSRANVNITLKDTGHSIVGRAAQRLRQGLVVVEIALSLVLLIGAGLMMRSFALLKNVNPGFDARQTLVFSIAPNAKYNSLPPLAGFFQRLEERLAALPGVTAVGAVSHLPFDGRTLTGSYAFDERTEQDWGNLSADYRVITPGYFRALGIPLLSGRLYTWQDVSTPSNTVVIDENLARRAWPDENPLGKRVKLGLGGKPSWMEVIGVVGHVHNDELQSEGRDQVYLTHRDAAVPVMNVTVRSSGETDNLTGAIRQAMKDVDSEIPIYNIRGMSEYLDRATAGDRFILILLSLFAASALILAAVGIYGLISYSAQQRTREIGIRMALGAERRDILKLVIGQGMRLVTAGVVIGLAAALGLTRVIESHLYGVRPTDAQTFALVSGVLMMVALLACYIPAHRATKVAPSVALRHE